MQFAGVIPEDGPDPQLEIDARVRSLPFAIVGLEPQPTLEDAGLVSPQESGDQRGPSQVSAALSYQLWRNPADREDPIILVKLDEASRAAIEHEPPWPRPAWLVERAQRMRYPLLWETVRTTWNRDASGDTTVQRLLVEHTNYILMNQYREPLGLEPGPTIVDGAMERHQSAVNSVATARLDGMEVPAAEIDTDPFV
ncbi:hypothetical protein [Agromyces bauzanensis]|nr:hypothetical protein [Agromyces bauzanensis]